MREYLRKFFEYQDQLFWSKDIDNIDKRIDMWLKSEEYEALIIPVVSKSVVCKHKAKSLTKKEVEENRSNAYEYLKL